jgi:cytochrome c-type protein NapB
MKLGNIILMAVLTAFSSSMLFASAIDDLNMGLSKESVFEVPTPSNANFPDYKPGKSDRLDKAYSTLPPQMLHRVEEYLPITLEENECLDCHDRRKLLEREWRKGKKLPMPDDHYGTFAKKGGTEDVSGSRYNCMQCHVPTSDAKPLVDNTF